MSTDVQVQLLLSASKKAIIIDCLFLLSDILLLIIENYTGHLQITFSCISIIIIQLITTSRISQIESRILSECSNMITDIGGTKINGQENNLALGPDSIPARGEVTDG